MDLATVDELLTTTRSVRKRLDFKRPVEPALIEECLELSLQAPTGSNAQGWHFLVVTDADKRKALADLYRKGFEQYAAMQQESPPGYAADDPRADQMPRVIDSAMYLNEHLHEAPVFLIACVQGRFEEMPQMVQASIYGSILPAVWSFMLAARSRGLGSAWTTIHIFYEKEAAKILGIPDDWTQAALLPVAHYKGEGFKPAKRLPLSQVSSWNQWGKPRG